MSKSLFFKTNRNCKSINKKQLLCQLLVCMYIVVDDDDGNDVVSCIIINQTVTSLSENNKIPLSHLTLFSECFRTRPK